MRDHAWVRPALGFTVFATAYYLAYRYGMAFGETTASPFWFPDSVLLCGLLWARPKWWWALLAATVPIRLLIALPPDVPLLFAAATTLIDCGKAVVAAALLRRMLRNPLRFQTVRDFGVYCLIVVLGVPAVGAFAGALARWVIGYKYWPGWQQWFLGDALASLIITPFVFYWILSPPDVRQVAAPRRIEAGVLLCCMLASFWLAFEPSSTALGFADARMYLPTALLVWAAIRFGMVGASGAIALLAVFAVGSAVSGLGVFSADSPETVGANLQGFLLHAAPLYLLAVLIDQTRRGAESLRESERRFRDLADTAPALIWMAGPDKLCDFFNANWLDFTGRTLQEESGNGWAAGVHPDDYGDCFKTFVSCFDARLPFEMDYRLRRHDGEYRWILDRGIPRYGTKGEFLGYIGSAIDVTDRRLQEAAVRRSEERYRDVVEQQTDFVCRFLADTTLTFVNDAYCRFLRCDKDELLHQKFVSLLPTAAQASTLAALASATSSREACEWESDSELGDGGFAAVHWACRALFDGDGHFQEFQAVGHDITDRKRAEEADRKLAHTGRLAALGELTALVAHQINQPLCAIVSNAEAAGAMLRKAAMPGDEMRQILSDISKDSLRVSEVIQGIRTLTRKRDPERRPIDVNQTVESALRLVTGDALRRRVQIRRELAADLPMVFADSPSLEQVILNLIVNGMDAMNETPQRARQITVKTQRGGGSVVIAVADRGHGIPPERMSRLFESFFTTKRDGVGLGLSISRSIVQAHGGRIWAENTPGGGSTFCFTVRVVEAVPMARHVQRDLGFASDVPVPLDARHWTLDAG